MKRLDMRLVGGLLLIVGGVFYLLNNLNIIRWGNLVWAAIAAVAAIALFAAVVRDRRQWWYLIPGMVLTAVAATILLEYFAPALESQWSGSLFLGLIGLAFWAIFAIDRKMWWAIIPGGVLLTLAVVAGLEDVSGIDNGGVLFLGMGLTFGLLALLPIENGHRARWPLFPCVALLVLGALFFVGFERAIGYLWPAALIIGGLLLLARAWRTRAG